MRIVVNDIAASKGGAMSVLRDFYQCVCENDRENEWIFLLSDRYFEETDNVKIIVRDDIKKSKIKKLLFDFVIGKKYIKSLAPDVVFSMQNIITFGLKVPQVVYIHQSIPFQSIKKFSFFKKNERNLAIVQYLIGWIIKLSAKKSSHVIVQTKWMKEALCKKCRISSDKVLASLPTVKAEEKKIGLDFDKTSFFYPTAPAIYKNNDCIRKASQFLDERGIEHEITLTLPQDQSKGSVICCGRLPHDEVMTRYCQSTLVFPSYIETFGYPLAEARQMGTIVLASDTPFSREVLDGYENAYYFDPFKPEELALLMERVMSGSIVKKISAELSNSNDCWKDVISVLI